MEENKEKAALKEKKRKFTALNHDKKYLKAGIFYSVLELVKCSFALRATVVLKG